MLAPKSQAAVSRRFMRNLYYLPKYLETHTIYTLFGHGEAPFAQVGNGNSKPDCRRAQINADKTFVLNGDLKAVIAAALRIFKRV
jgi:hypothetical protein